MDFSVIGMSFENINSSQVSKLVLNKNEITELMYDLSQTKVDGEAFIIATSNRIEFCVYGNAMADLVYFWLGKRRTEVKGLNPKNALRYELEGDDAVRHLVNLYIGLEEEDALEGKISILNGFEISKRFNLLGKNLLPLNQLISQIGDEFSELKEKLVSENDSGILFSHYINERRVIFQPHREPRLLFICEKESTDYHVIINQLKYSGCGDIVFVNKDDNWAENFAYQNDLIFSPFASLGTELLLADYVFIHGNNKDWNNIKHIFKRVDSLGLNDGLLILEENNTIAENEYISLQKINKNQLPHQIDKKVWLKNFFFEKIAEVIHEWIYLNRKEEDSKWLNYVIQDIEEFGLQRPTANNDKEIRNSQEIKLSAVNSFKGLIHDCANYLNPIDKKERFKKAN